MNAYSVERKKTPANGLDIIRLIDEAHQTEVSVLASIGFNGFDMRVKGKPIFWSPYAPSEIDQQKARPTMLGNPFLAPWANRLDHEGFYFAGHHYPLNPDLKNYRPKQAIHGLLVYTDRWEVVEAAANATSAHVTAKLDFYKYPDLMAQFPFAHTLELTYRLSAGVLEVETVIRNHAVTAIPVSLGFHPYFQITDAPRDDWQVTLPARDQVLLAPELVPTGELRPNPYGERFLLKGVHLDDVFTNISPSNRGFSIAGKSQKITVEYGPKFQVAVVYAPPGPNRDFLCFEPMTAITNGMNLAHQGKYAELQTVAAGAVWRESYWVKPTGY